MQAVKKKLTLDNPAYHVMKRKGNTRALYGIPRHFTYYKTTPEYELVIPRGCLPWLLRLHEVYEYPIEVYYNTVVQYLPFKLGSDQLELRDYQKGVPEEVITRGKQGILKLSTGWGKTILALKLVEHTQLNTIILTHRRSLLAQFLTEFEKWYGYTPGVIADGNNTIKAVTVAMVQTLYNRFEANPEIIPHLQNQFGMVIVDECHTMITDNRRAVLNVFTPDRFYGMSATPERSDGQSEAVKFVFGPTLVEHSLPQDKPTVLQHKTTAEIPAMEYTDMARRLAEHPERNLTIAKVLRKQIGEGRKVLVLTKRIAHYEYIKQYLSDRLTVHTISSQRKAKENTELLRQLREQEIEYDVIMGTYSMLSTGIDIPNLDTLIFAGDLKSSVLTKQSAGRILRLFHGKQHPRIIDMVDKENRTFARHARERQKFYKENEWPVQLYGKEKRI